MRRHGFTLIELLIVIAIIAILAAILFPIFVRTKEAAKISMCMSNMRTLAKATMLYADDNSGMLPALNLFMTARGTGADPNDVYGDARTGALWPYHKNKKVLVCPTDVFRKKDPDYAKVQPLSAPHDYFSYTMNGFLTLCIQTQFLQPGENGRVASNTRGVPMSVSKRPSRTILLVEESTDRAMNNLIVNDALFIWDDWTSLRHGIFTNVVFLDGHAKRVEGRQQWKSARYPDGTYVFQQ